MSNKIIRVFVKVGEDVVLIQKPHKSAPTLAKILGIDRDQDGNVQCIWLDRLVHHIGEHWSDDSEWQIGGAVVSVLTRQYLSPEGTPNNRGLA